MSDVDVRRIVPPFPVVDHGATKPFPTLDHLSLRLKLYRWLLSEIWPDAPGLRLVDLGSGRGDFARVASRRGFRVTAVDARPPWTLTGATSVAATSREFDFVQRDLRTIASFEDHDVVACIGVLYHLPYEDQRRLLERCAGRPVVIDTEVYEAERIPASRRDRFSPTSFDGYEGAVCRELGQVFSSHGDPFSFWFKENSLLRFFADLGRDRVTVGPTYYSAFGPRMWCVLHA